MAAIQPLPDQPDFARPSVLQAKVAITTEELQAALQAILEAVHASEARVTAKINEQFSLLVLRLHNSECPHDAQLIYPAGVNSQHFPQNKTELHQTGGKSLT